MNMEFRRKMPIPKEVKEMYPISEELVKIKEKRDNEIKAVFSGKSDSRQGRTFFHKETPFFSCGFVPSAVDSPNAGGL